MDNLDYIEDYFKSKPTPGQSRQFGERIEADPAFAEEVVFYLSALQVCGEQAQTEQKQRFRKIYGENRFPGRQRPVRKLIYYLAAAAAIAGIIFGISVFMTPASTQKLADQYIGSHLQTLGVQMSDREDSLQSGLLLFNEGKLQEALLQFEKIIQSDTSNFTAKKYAGIVSLRLKEYDKSLAYFKDLGTYSTLYANPARFFQALTLMERNQSGDRQQAKQLLQEVVQQDLEGKEVAEDWLKKW